MAQTKAQTKKPSASKRSKPASKSKATKSKSAKPKAAKRKAPKKASKPKSTSSKSPRSTGSGASNGASGPTARVDAVRHAVGDKAKGAGKTVGNAGKSVGKAASKAKVPLVAGGAAIAGAAGGMALASSKGRKGGIASALNHKPRVMPRKPLIKKPRVKIKSGDLKKAAKDVGNFGAQVGALANELQQARDSENGSKHRSPLEVVLQGLTARR